MVVVIHISEMQLLFLLIVLSKRKWLYRLHTWVMDESPSISKKYPTDTQYWVVCWREADGELVMRHENEDNIQK